MKVKAFSSLILVGLSCIMQGMAATTATALVTFTVNPIINITISGNPGSLIVTGGTSSTDTSTTYGVTSNLSSQTITGMIDSAMPPGVSLSVELQGPTSSTSIGAVDMTTTPQSLVDSISPCCQSDLMIKYKLTADIHAVPVPTTSRIVTFTIGP